MARKRKPQDHTQDRIARETEAIEFIKLNAPYMNHFAMRNTLNVSHEKLEALIVAAQADVSKEMREPRAEDIIGDIGFLPIGTVVEQWERGTMIHLQSNIPGINGITRHYGLGDE